ncbi:MAG: hypothetical protein ACRBEE_12405 [Arenicella sp.]
MQIDSFRTHKVLSIYPNIHGFAFSYFESPRDLVDWGNISFKGKNYDQKLQNLIDTLNPEIIVTEDNKGSESGRSKRVNKILDDLYKLTKKNNIYLKKYSPSMIKGVFDCFEAYNKHERAILVASWFPELTTKLPPKRKIWLPEHYRMGVFDSMTYALAFFYTEG